MPPRPRPLTLGVEEPVTPELVTRPPPCWTLPADRAPHPEPSGVRSERAADLFSGGATAQLSSTDGDPATVPLYCGP